MLSLIGAGKAITPTCDWAGGFYARPDVAFVPLSGARAVHQALIRAAGRDSIASRIFAHSVLEQAEADASIPLS
ncbi:hypothetical protein ACWCPQ_23285 [Nocardia sp. NPDC001965]